METTRLSSKGQIIIPQAIRDAHHWQPGLDFTVMEMEEGILLKPVKAFKTSAIQEVLGCTGYKGKKKTLKEMEQGIAQGAKHDRS